MSTLPDNWPALWAERQADAQRKTHVHLCGIPYARLPYGKEEVQGGDTCRDCGVVRGQLHVPTCCIERCPICLGQAHSCGCPDDDDDEEEVEA